MSEFDATELGSCWNCGALTPGSNLPPPHTPAILQRSGRRRAIHFHWLFLPWLSILGLMIAPATNMDRWLLDSLPYGLGSMARKNVGYGLLLVFVGSSARWAYLRYSEFGFEKLELYMKVVGVTILLLFIHACVPIAVFLVIAIPLIVLRAMGP
jgi:hypothetical protein